MANSKESGPHTRQLQNLLDRLRAGDESARDALIEHACDRLRSLTRRLKRDFPVVSRWEQTDDVFQQAIMRLHRSLADVHPENVKAFRGLASQQICRELIDIVRKLKGAEGIAKNHASDQLLTPSGNPSPGRIQREIADTDGPEELSLWTEFHQHVEGLPVGERDVFHLHYYQGMPQEEVAELLGVSIRTVKRRWRTSKLLLHDAIQAENNTGHKSR